MARRAPPASEDDAPAPKPTVDLGNIEVDDDISNVPRLPRGRGLKLSYGEMVRIALTAAMLIAVLVLARPCANAVGRFIGNFDPPDAQPAAPRPVQVPAGYVHLTPNMTPEQIQEAINAARDAGVAPLDAPGTPPTPSPTPSPSR